jgi:hypothetical protein
MRQHDASKRDGYAKKNANLTPAVWDGPRGRALFLQHAATLTPGLMGTWPSENRLPLWFLSETSGYLGVILTPGPSLLQATAL